jgi:hypothetical protein
MKPSSRPDRHPALGWTFSAGGALMLLFWTLYLGGVLDLGQEDPIVSAFETAFVLADSVLGLLLCAAGWSLLRGRPGGLYLMVVAASMSLYLGLLDLAFYARVGLYGTLSVASVFELSLNLFCIGGGATCLWIGWRWQRRGRRSDLDIEVHPIRPYVGSAGWRIGGAA